MKLKTYFLQVSFYAEEHNLKNLYCGRQYHMVMYQSNYVGESEASQIINTQSVGEKPAPPLQSSFIIVNSTLAILLLEKGQQASCSILYFVIEYKLNSDNPWTFGNPYLIPISIIYFNFAEGKKRENFKTEFD